VLRDSTSSDEETGLEGFEGFGIVVGFSRKKLKIKSEIRFAKFAKLIVSN
jgi:hypothetical protein